MNFCSFVCYLLIMIITAGLISVMEVNYFGAVALTKKLLPLLRISKGRVINVSSVGGMLVTGGGSAYASSKFALDAFTDGLRKELKPQGIAVIGISAGVIKTAIHEKVQSVSFKRPEDVDVDVWALYDRYVSKEKSEKFQKMVDLGLTTESSNEAIVDALVSSRPSSRYVFNHDCNK